jgi:uncharacterized protein with HEPN domain
MSKREIDLLVNDMLQSSLKIKNYIGTYTFDEFIDDDKTIDAVVRNFTIIGEASTRIDEDIKIAYPLIDWIDIRGLRNRIIHEYFGVDYKLIWTIYETELDFLIEHLKILLEIVKNKE